MPLLRPLAISLLLAFGAAAGVASPPASAKRPGFVGIVSDDGFKGSSHYRKRTLRAQADAGVSVVRQVFHWSSIERRPGRYSLQDYDAYVAAVAAHGMQVLPVLISPPRFRAARARRGARPIDACPPRNYGDFRTFAAELVRRYGRSGSFWRERPELPKVPITSWQIWNEPNLPAFWCTGPSGAAYARMLRAVAGAIRAVDRRAEVVTAAIPDADTRHIRGSIGFEPFAQEMYRAGVKGAFDTLATNTFRKPVGGVLAEIGTVRRFLDRQRDRRRRIWVTELGWATGGPDRRQRVSLREQATRIRTALPALARRRARLGLRGVIYYSWRDDTRPLCPTCGDYAGRYTGLVDRRGRRKPALEAFRSTVLALR